MTNSKFRPRFECLEGRDVPASLTFQFADGTTGYGTFTEPAGVDDSASIWLEVADLTVYYNGTAYEATGTVEAWYDYGSLADIAGTFVDASSNSITLGFNTATFNTYSTPFTLDPADTQATFTLPGNVTGVLSYDVPHGLVDATQANQSVALTTFNLNIAGQNFTYGSASYTTAPTATFQYGDLVGINFALNTSSVTGFLYSSISATNSVITAVNAITNQPVNAPVVNANASVVLDFSTITIPTAAQGEQDFRIRVTAADGTEKLVEVKVNPGDTKTQVRNAFEEALTAAGFKATTVGTVWLDIKGTAGAASSQLTKVETFNFGYTGNHPKLLERTPGPTGTFPTYINTT